MSIVITRNTYIRIPFRTDVNTRRIKMSRAKIYRKYEHLL